jgi:hypothetical protein
VTVIHDEHGGFNSRNDSPSWLLDTDNKSGFGVRKNSALITNPRIYEPRLLMNIGNRDIGEISKQGFKRGSCGNRIPESTDESHKKDDLRKSTHIFDNKC